MNNTPLKKSKGIHIGINTGASSVMVIFVVISLVTFAIMSLVAANADYRLSKQVAERNVAYYDATSAAQLKLRDEAVKVRAMTEFADFVVPVSGEQQLHVVATLPATGTSEDVNILKWQLENGEENAESKN